MKESFFFQSTILKYRQRSHDRGGRMGGCFRGNKTDENLVIIDSLPCKTFLEFHNKTALWFPLKY